MKKIISLSIILILSLILFLFHSYPKYNFKKSILGEWNYEGYEADKNISNDILDIYETSLIGKVLILKNNNEVNYNNELHLYEIDYENEKIKFSNYYLELKNNNLYLSNLNEKRIKIIFKK